MVPPDVRHPVPPPSGPRPRRATPNPDCRPRGWRRPRVGGQNHIEPARGAGGERQRTDRVPRVCSLGRATPRSAAHLLPQTPRNRRSAFVVGRRRPHRTPRQNNVGSNPTAAPYRRVGARRPSTATLLCDVARPIAEVPICAGQSVTERCRQAPCDREREVRGAPRDPRRVSDVGAGTWGQAPGMIIRQE
jgi:hypothetical protein